MSALWKTLLSLANLIVNLRLEILQFILKAQVQKSEVNFRWLDYRSNIIGDELLLNFGAKFQR